MIPAGRKIVECGVIWNTFPEPSSGNYCSTTESEKPFVCQITGLTPGTSYYVRAYAMEQVSHHSFDYYYGEDMVFTTTGGGFNGHDYVDLGLPSGTLWATCNVGANAPEEYGHYYAWGETLPKSYYSWGTYQYTPEGNNDAPRGFVKYCWKAEDGLNGYTDNLSTLVSSDDAATVNWGGSWRTPTEEEWSELFFAWVFGVNCEWTTQNGVKGELFTAPNGNRLFLPAAGKRILDTFCQPDSVCFYWSSSLCGTYGAFYYDSNGTSFDYRYLGQPIRPVCSAPKK